MTKNHKGLKKTKRIKFFVFVVTALLIILAGFFAYRYLIASKGNNYLVKNKYYNFQLNTPKNWVAQEAVYYSEDNITRFVSQCKNDKSNASFAYEIGDFRFKSYRYPDDFGSDGYFAPGSPSGAILEVKVGCVHDSAKGLDINNKYGKLTVANGKAMEEVLKSEFGKEKSIAFFHNNIQYIITEDVYTSPKDSEGKVNSYYTKIFDKIISSFKFND